MAASVTQSEHAQRLQPFYELDIGIIERVPSLGLSLTGKGCIRYNSLEAANIYIKNAHVLKKTFWTIFIVCMWGRGVTQLKVNNRTHSDSLPFPGPQTPAVCKHIRFLSHCSKRAFIQCFSLPLAGSPVSQALLLCVRVYWWFPRPSQDSVHVTAYWECLEAVLSWCKKYRFTQKNYGQFYKERDLILRRRM